MSIVKSHIGYSSSNIAEHKLTRLKFWVNIYLTPQFFIGNKMRMPHKVGDL